MTGPLRQVPPVYSAVQVGGRRAYQMARAGEAVELAPRDVVIHELDLLEWDDADPARPIAVVDVALLGGDVRPRAGPRPRRAARRRAPTSGALVRTASGGFRLEDAVPLDVLREHAADGPAGIAAAMLRPIDAGLEDLPHAPITDGRDPAPGRGPAHRRRRRRSSRPRRAARAGRRARTGRVVAVCRAVVRERCTRTRSSRRAARRPPARRRRPAPRPTPARAEADADAMRVARGLDAAGAGRPPGVRRRRRLRRPPPRPRVPAGASRGGGAPPRRPARGRSPSTTTPTRSSPGTAPAPAVRPGGAAGASRGRRRRRDRRRPLRPAPARDDLRRVRRAIAARGPLAGLPHDAGCGVRLPARRDPRGARRRSDAPRASRWSSCRRSSSTGTPVRSTEVRAAIAAGDLGARGPAARPAARGGR